MKLMHVLGAALGVAAACALAGVPAARAGGSGLDDQGYIRDWLMLAPIFLPEGSMAADAIFREQVRGEASLRPKPGDSVSVQGRNLTWRKISASTNYFDLNAALNSQNDQAAGYVVTYVESDRDIPEALMAVASNDQGRIYLNGAEIYAYSEARPLMLDADKGKVPLKKGVNVIVFKIINEQNAWQGALRLLDMSGAPLKGLSIREAP